MIHPYGVVATVLLWTAQGTPLDGTWQLTRIFRAGTPAATHAVPIDSTVYIRMSLESHTGGWFTGWLYRRYLGQPERTKLGGGPLRGTGRWILGADFDRPRRRQRAAEHGSNHLHRAASHHGVPGREFPALPLRHGGVRAARRG